MGYCREHLRHTSAPSCTWTWIHIVNNVRKWNWDNNDFKIHTSNKVVWICLSITSWFSKQIFSGNASGSEIPIWNINIVINVKWKKQNEQTSTHEIIVIKIEIIFSMNYTCSKDFLKKCVKTNIKVVLKTIIIIIIIILHRQKNTNLLHWPW